jgi:hypothetical protein
MGGVRLMSYKTVDSVVYTIEEIETSKQTATIEKFYDHEFNTVITGDKYTVSADGNDIVTINAEVHNYLDEPQINWTGDIIFELDGEEQVVPTATGRAEITFSTSVPGEYIIKTTISNLRNGEVKVVAK